MGLGYWNEREVSVERRQQIAELIRRGDPDKMRRGEAPGRIAASRGVSNQSMLDTLQDMEVEHVEGPVRQPHDGYLWDTPIIVPVRFDPRFSLPSGENALLDLDGEPIPYEDFERQVRGKADHWMRRANQDGGASYFIDHKVQTNLNGPRPLGGVREDELLWVTKRRTNTFRERTRLHPVHQALYDTVRDEIMDRGFTYSILKRL